MVHFIKLKEVRTGRKTTKEAKRTIVTVENIIVALNQLATQQQMYFSYTQQAHTQILHGETGTAIGRAGTAYTNRQIGDIGTSTTC